MFTNTQSSKIQVFPSSLQSSTKDQSILLLWTVIIAIAFTALIYSVCNHGILTTLNEPTQHLMRSLRSATADHFFIGVTLFSVPVVIPMWLSVFAWLVFRKNWWAAFHWFGVGLMAILASEFFKDAIHFTRPEGLYKTPSGWSFPSAHTAVNITLFGFLAVLLSQSRATGKNGGIFIIAFCLPLLILTSRLYLTAHWLTDVIGGILLATECILLATISYRRKPVAPIQMTGVIFVAILSLSLSWGWALHTQYDVHMRNYALVELSSAKIS